MFKFLQKQKTRKKSFQSRRQKTDDNSEDISLSRRHKPDYIIILVAIALSITGLVVVYSISPALAAGQDVSGNFYVFKQLIAIGLGLLAFGLFSILPIKFIRKNTKFFMWFSAVMIILVQLFGEKVNGAYRWIQIGGFSFQVAELIKFTIIVWLASFLVIKLSEGNIKSTNKTLRPIVTLVIVTAVVIIGLQSDFGSAVVAMAIIGLMAFSAGLPMMRIGLVFALITIGMLLVIVATPYRRERVVTFINPTSDCQNEGYQSCQALIAVGSGGIAGLGLANGVQAYGYLPEAENDSIFAIVGEKFGFIGASIIIGLYALLFSRMQRIIKRTSDSFSRLIVIGILAWISTQAIINIGAMIGLLPLKGITLPLISYGGTSLLFVLAALGLVFQISRYTSYSPIRNVALNNEEGREDENPTSRRRQRRPHYAASSNRF